MRLIQSQRKLNARSPPAPTVLRSGDNIFLKLLDKIKLIELYRVAVFLLVLVCVSIVRKAFVQKEAADDGSQTELLGGAFIHMGRTGGKALSSLLRNGCDSSEPHPCHDIPTNEESMASKLVERYYHLFDFKSLPEHRHSFYILTLRDPYARLVSAFVNEHIDNVIALNEEKMSYMQRYVRSVSYQCFPSLDSFVEHIGDHYDSYDYPYPEGTIKVGECTNLAKAVIHGKVRPFNHFFYNYQKILSYLAPHLGEKEEEQEATTENLSLSLRTKASSSVLASFFWSFFCSTPKVYVIRYEFMWEDWKQINVMLGQPEKTVQIPTEMINHSSSPNKHTRRRQPVHSSLNAKRRLQLCNALTKEYVTYLKFLSLAINLTPKQVKDTLFFSQLNCPNLDFILE